MAAIPTPHDEKRHKCLIYEGQPSEQLPVVVPLLLDGLAGNWRCLYLGDPASLDMISGALEQRGIDTDREAKRGALILSSDRSHLDSGTFEPAALVESLASSIDDAVGAGFRGLCATGDMRWELGPDKNFERLLEYEARLEQLFRTKPLMGICQYHRDILPDKAVRDALGTHQATYMGRTLNHDNLFYLPPEMYLAASADSAKQGEWMCQQIVRVLAAERSRDAAMDALKQSEAALRRAVEVRDDFLAIASHELRTPLTPLVLNLSAALRGLPESSGDSRSRLEAAQRHVQRLSMLVEHLLDVTRISSDGLVLKPVRLDLARVVGTVVRQVADTLRSGEAQVHAPEDGVIGYWDEAGIESVVLNLVTNAFKYGAGKPVEVNVSASGGRARVDVVDHGIGMPVSEQARIFERFERAVPSRNYGGFGLGLWVARGIVQAHGGTLTVSSAQGQGSTFSVELPCGAPSPLS